MRPLRLLLSLSACLVSIFLLSYFAASRTSSNSATRSTGSFGAYLNWQSSSLFPPSAIISLTDDNSTFFLARPANFGRSLPAKGLDGQLWIGSGFGDENLGRGRVASSKGELGCSDVPGWGDGDYGSLSSATNDMSGKSKTSGSASKAAVDAKAAKTKSKRNTDPEVSSLEQPDEADGTDDHLHQPLLSASGDRKNSLQSASGAKKLAHADIQSLQETAEIAGKVVLLTRGGCGFLEKAKWVQRRGGIALIVGDNVRGGALVTMYARGDTSNITIPALFTSHTTAHLLSSLVPSGNVQDDVDLDEAARLGLALGDKTASSKPDTKQTISGKQQQSQPNPLNDKSGLDSSQSITEKDAKSSDRQSSKHDSGTPAKQGWFGSILGSSPKGVHEDTRRPPSSGKIGWIEQKDFEEDVPADAAKKTRKAGNTKSSNQDTKSPTNDAKKSNEGFVIGVQDWRDPDLLDAQHEAAQNSPSQQNKAENAEATAHRVPNGGSITPSSGEYDRAKNTPGDGRSSTKDQAKAPVKSNPVEDKQDVKSESWLNRLGLSSKDDKNGQLTPDKAPHVVTLVGTKSSTTPNQNKKEDQDDTHEGLWVTLTPTSMSASPFFDTLLVLVISPLVTLTIVYALLLLRSRIRRRRWRAPKSVVERLPVRTYHTIASTTSSSSTENSPPRSPTTPNSTTPLLHSSARPISQGRARPRSRTESEVPATGSSFRDTNNSSIDAAQEKREAGLAEWRRRYVGRQKECVVCLEEYVDGVSRVMSLPCGHEFHAECISPWLTTRRRTCPICKSDVVRSIGRSTASPSSQPLVPGARYDDADEDNTAGDSDRVQEQAAAARNDDPASVEPVSRDDEAFEDLERGLDEDRSR